jgi:hypothetical protein
MITFTARPITVEEKQQVTMKSDSLYKSIEHFAMPLVGILLVLDAPLLLYDHFKPVASNIQAIYCIIAAGVALLLTLGLTIRRSSNRRRHNEAIPKQVEVIKVTTTRAVKRKDFEDFGIAFYVDVTDKGQQKTLFLWGQYLDVWEYEKTFPNTEFEIVRLENAHEFIEFRLLGHYFKAERTLPAFDKEIWQTGIYPVNGQLINMNIEAILE